MERRIWAKQRQQTIDLFWQSRETKRLAWMAIMLHRTRRLPDLNPWMNGETSRAITDPKERAELQADFEEIERTLGAK